MKPKSWDEFLRQTADDYEVQGKLKGIFLARFAYEHWRKPDKEIWQLAQAASPETYKKQMTEIYAAFSKPDGCPELIPSHKGPGKFQALREWLKDIKYPQWCQSVSSLAPAELKVPPEEARAAALSLLNPLVKRDSLYIQHSLIEAECYQELVAPGSLIRIKAPQKMGKTLLLSRLLSYAEANGYRRVYINLSEAEGAIFGGLDKFLRWLCANLSRELGLKPALDDYWDEELFGSLVSCKTYFQGYVLEQIDAPLALGLDNVDRVFEYPHIAMDFLPMLRNWHEEAKNFDVWQKLRLIVANSTEAYIKLDANQSPFNVGRQVKLPGLNLEQVQNLAEGYGLDWTIDTQKQLAESLTVMVGGHPYLIRLALDSLAHQTINLEQLLEEAPTQGGIYGDHLRHHWDNLQKQPELEAAMKAVVTAQRGISLEPILAYKLESMGLVQLQGDEVSPSCELYQQYFRVRMA